MDGYVDRTERQNDSVKTVRELSAEAREGESESERMAMKDVCRQKV